MIQTKNNISKEWYILTGIYLIYFAHSTLFPSLSFIGQLLIFVILFVGLVNLIRTLKYPTLIPICEKWVIVMLTILTLSYIFSPKIISSRMMEPTPTLNQFKDMVAYFLPIFTGFQIGLHKKITAKQWLVISLLILLLGIYSFYLSKQEALFLHNLKETTNNSAYIFLHILPFLPLVLNRYKSLTLALLTFCFIFVMMGAKRGAIVCMGCIILYLMWWYLKRQHYSPKTILLILSIFTIFLIGINYFLNESDYLQKRLQQTLEGNTSRRDVIYYILWNKWINADLLTQLFGRGSAQTVPLAGNYAHNDWLELLTDVGLVGAFVYLMCIVSLFKFRKKLPKKSPEQAAFTSVIILWLLKTIFSMGMGIVGGISMMFLGTLIGNKILINRMKIKQKVLRAQC